MRLRYTRLYSVHIDSLHTPQFLIQAEFLGHYCDFVFGTVSDWSEPRLLSFYADWSGGPSSPSDQSTASGPAGSALVLCKYKRDKRERLTAILII